MNFRMCGELKFNRNIKETDYISLGGYSMKMDGKMVTFDFEDFEGSICTKDSSCLYFELKNPMFDYITIDNQIGEITEKMLSNVENIEDFFVYLDEDNTDLKCIKINKLSFILPDDNYKQLPISKKILKDANVNND